MTDTLRTRVARFIAGGAHALVDRLEDAAPLAVLEQSIREVDRLTDEVRAELGRAAASRHLAQQQHLNLNREHESLAQSIDAALAAGRDDLARTALARQMDIEAQLPVLESSLADLAGQEKELAGYVDALMGKRREMETAVRDLEAAQKRSATGSPTAAGAASGSVAQRLQATQSAFDRTYARQAGLPSAGAATLAQTAQLRDLEKLVRENQIEQRLAARKAGSR